MVFVADDVRRIRGEYGNDVLPRHIARPSVQMPLIAHTHPPLLATGGAESGGGNELLLPIEDR